MSTWTSRGENIFNPLAMNKSIITYASRDALHAYVFYVAPDNFLPHPPESVTAHLQQDRWCSTQSCEFHTAAMQYDWCLEVRRAENRDSISSCGRLRSIEIHRRLWSVCGKDGIDVSSVRHWVSFIKSGEKIIGWRACGSPSSTTAKPETKQNADALIRDDRDVRDWRTGCYCHHEKTWLQRNARISHHRTRRRLKKCLCRSHNILPTTAPQLHIMVTCDTLSTSFALSRPFSGRRRTEKNAVLKVITEISRNTVKRINIKMVKNLFDQTLNILTSFFTFIFAWSPAPDGL